VPSESLVNSASRVAELQQILAQTRWPSAIVAGRAASTPLQNRNTTELNSNLTAMAYLDGENTLAMWPDYSTGVMFCV
jgi:hypothetical protein